MTSGEPAGWGAPLYAHALDAADVGAGTSVLDLGCGTGEFAAAAVARGRGWSGWTATRTP